MDGSGTRRNLFAGAEVDAKRRLLRLAAAELVPSRLPKRECRLHRQGSFQESGGTSSAQNPLYDRLRRKWTEEQMIKNGWCPHQVRHLSLKYDVKTLSYLAELERSPLRAVNHQRCSLQDSCVAYNTDPTNYESRHTNTDCTCTMISVSYASLIKTIRSGHVPLISIENGTPGSSERHTLRVLAGSSTSKYIAISHVWADGLGNPRENGLPSCQIEQLRMSLLACKQVCIILQPLVNGKPTRSEIILIL